MPRRPREEMRRAREAEGVMAASLKSNEVVPASNTRSARFTPRKLSRR